MFLYTPLSDSDIYSYEDFSENRKIITYDGKMIHVEETSEGSYQLLQLLSTDPQDFLNEGLSPGRVISLFNNNQTND